MAIESRISTEDINIKDLSLNREAEKNDFQFDPSVEISLKDWEKNKRKFEEDRLAGNWSAVLFDVASERFFRGAQSELHLNEEAWNKIIEYANKVWQKAARHQFSISDKVGAIAIAGSIRELDPEKLKLISMEGFDAKGWWQTERTELLRATHVLSRAESFGHGLDLKILYPDMEPFPPEVWITAKETLATLTAGKKVSGIAKRQELSVAGELLSKIKIFFPERYASLDSKLKEKIWKIFRDDFEMAKQTPNESFSMLWTAKQMAILSAAEINFGPRGMELSKAVKSSKTPSVPEHKKF